MRCLIRGGDWNNGANAGVFSSNLYNARSNFNVNVGGRSAFRPKALNARRCSGVTEKHAGHSTHEIGESPRRICGPRSTGRGRVRGLKGAFFLSREECGKKFELPWRRERHTRHRGNDL